MSGSPTPSSKLNLYVYSRKRREESASAHLKRSSALAVPSYTFSGVSWRQWVSCSVQIEDISPLSSSAGQVPAVGVGLRTNTGKNKAESWGSHLCRALPVCHRFLSHLDSGRPVISRVWEHDDPLRSGQHGVLHLKTDERVRVLWITFFFTGIYHFLPYFLWIFFRIWQWRSSPSH